MSLPADAFPADEEKAIAAFIEDLDASGGALVLDSWMLTEIVPRAMARILDTHRPDSAGRCGGCGRRPCPLRQTALAYTGGLVADNADYHPVARGVARAPRLPDKPPYDAVNGSRRPGWLRRPPAGGDAS